MSVKGDVFSFNSFRDPVFLSKTLVYVNVSQRAYGWCTQPACTYMRTRILEPCLPPETGEHPSLSSGLSDAPWHKRRRPGSLGPRTGGTGSFLTATFQWGGANRTRKFAPKKLLIRFAPKNLLVRFATFPPPQENWTASCFFIFLRPGSALAQPNF